MILEPKTIALFFTVVLLAVTTYFLLGSVPLLTLKHDNPIDARFIKSFYVTYFKIAIVAALATTTSYAMASRPLLALGAFTMASMTFYLKKQVIPMMDLMGQKIRDDGESAIRSFRKTHQKAIVINTGQLGIILFSLGSI